MAYNTDELEKEALKLIVDKKLFFITDVVALMACDRQTFYNHKLDKLDSIKEALAKNKVEVKNSLRKKWHDSDNPTTQVALYKLISEDDERKKLSQQYHDVTTDGDKLSTTVNVFSGMSDEQLDALGAELGAIINENRQSNSEPSSE